MSDSDRAFLEVLDALLGPPPGEMSTRTLHSHSCGNCGLAWEHSPDNLTEENHDKAHECPACGTASYWIDRQAKAICVWTGVEDLTEVCKAHKPVVVESVI